MRSLIILLATSCVCTGEVTYDGRSEDASWREHANRRIEQIRKAPLKVKVFDSRGVSAGGAKVHVRMRRHVFGFGNILNPRTFQLEGPDGLKYREMFAEHFNKTTFESGFRWQNWFVPARQGKLDEHKDLLDRMIRFCESRDIGIRGHYLSWAPLSRDSYKPTNYREHPSRLWPELSAHIDEMIAYVDGRLTEWDAINHIIGWNGTMADVTGTDEIYAKIIRHARSKTQTPLWVNEGAILPGGSRVEAYEEMVRYLFDDDAGPDRVGFMAHFKENSLRSIDGLYDIYERFAKFGVPLQLTEFDIDTADEQLQADYLRDVMTVTFSHRSFDAIIMWGFWEGRHWRPNGALWRRDWTIKPCGQVWKELVFDTWWTDERCTTNSHGSCEVSGFLGDYDIIVEHEGKEMAAELTLDKHGHTETIRF